MGNMTFSGKIDDIEEAEYDGFEEELLKHKKEEEEEENIKNEIPQDEVVENNLMDWMNTFCINLYLLVNVFTFICVNFYLNFVILIDPL